MSKARSMCSVGFEYVCICQAKCLPKVGSVYIAFLQNKADSLYRTFYVILPISPVKQLKSYRKLLSRRFSSDIVYCFKTFSSVLGLNPPLVIIYLTKVLLLLFFLAIIYLCRLKKVKIFFFRENYELRLLSKYF